MRFKAGTIMVRSCIMIEPVIYGPTPSMIMERFESPPPENIFRMPKNWLLERKRLSARVSMPGIGIAESNLKTISDKNTNKTLFRRVVSVQTNFVLFKKFCILPYELYKFLLYNYMPSLNTKTFSNL